MTCIRLWSERAIRGVQANCGAGMDEEGRASWSALSDEPASSRPGGVGDPNVCGLVLVGIHERNSEQC